MTSVQPIDASYNDVEMVDLFAGPGGLDVAAKWLKIEAVGVEWDFNARATRARAGLRTAPERDVRDNKPADFSEATILTGGPPCQTFTVAGSGAGRRALSTVLDLVAKMQHGEDVASIVDSLDDERTGLVLQPLRWALEAKRNGHPYEAIVLEQVPAVLPVWRVMRDVLRSEGYEADCHILRTEEFGVPQTRRRAILIARYKKELNFPIPTHRPYRKGVKRSVGSRDVLEWKTMGEALDRKYPFVVRSNYGTGGDPKARGERTSGEPAFTVTGKISRNVIIGARGTDRDRFTPDEAGRLQTFPKGYPWTVIEDLTPSVYDRVSAAWMGGDVSQQIGNAIPPRLAAHVLAAALGYTIDPEKLKSAVEKPWTESRNIDIRMLDGNGGVIQNLNAPAV